MKISKPKSKKEATALQIKLGWWLLEQKFLYYEGPKHNCSRPVSDDLYDKREDYYNKLSDKLGLEKSASKIVGFPLDTPISQLIASYIISNKKGTI